MHTTPQGFWHNDRFYPLIRGGAPEGDGGGEGGGYGAPESGGVAVADAPEADDADDGADDEPEAPEREEPEQRVSAFDRLRQQAEAPHQQVETAPRPEQVVQSQMQQLVLQDQADQREIALRLEYIRQFLPEDQAQAETQQLALAYQRAQLQRAQQALQLQDELRRAQWEPHLREVTLDRLVEIAKEDNPKVDTKALRQRLKEYADRGAPAEIVLQRAQEWANDHREEVLKERAQKGTDRAGSGQMQSSNDWKGRSLVEKLAMGYQESARSRRKR